MLLPTTGPRSSRTGDSRFDNADRNLPNALVPRVFSLVAVVVTVFSCGRAASSLRRVPHRAKRSVIARLVPCDTVSTFDDCAASFYEGKEAAAWTETGVWRDPREPGRIWVRARTTADACGRPGLG